MSPPSCSRASNRAYTLPVDTSTRCRAARSRTARRAWTGCRVTSTTASHVSLGDGGQTVVEVTVGGDEGGTGRWFGAPPRQAGDVVATAQRLQCDCAAEPRGSTQHQHPHRPSQPSRAARVQRVRHGRRRQTRRHTRPRFRGVTRPATSAVRPERKHHTWHCSWTPTPSRAGSPPATSRPPTRPTSRPRGTHGVSYLRYWVDEGAGKIFCLVEAPDAEAANTVHREAHGLVAEEIYSVSEHS